MDEPEKPVFMNSDGKIQTGRQRLFHQKRLLKRSGRFEKEPALKKKPLSIAVQANTGFAGTGFFTFLLHEAIFLL